MNSHLVPVSFKEVFSAKKYYIGVNPLIDVDKFITYLQSSLSRLFVIPKDQIEIVEAGQYNLNLIPELAPALKSSNTKLCNIWGKNLEGLAFYVRRKNYIYPQVEEIMKRRENKIFISECPICLENTKLTRRYSCNHGVCTNCYNRCILASINICSLCRSF